MLTIKEYVVFAVGLVLGRLFVTDVMDVGIMLAGMVLARCVVPILGLRGVTWIGFGLLRASRRVFWS